MILMDKSKYAVVDYRMDIECRENIESLGIKLIDSYKNKNVYKAIEGHVDINIFKIGENLFCSPESYEYYRDIFVREGIIEHINLIKAKTRLDKKYPKDIAYNICFTERYAIGRFADIDPLILEFLKKLSYDDKGSKLELIDINQGYANCSICQIDENSVISADKGVCKELKKKNIDVLEISQAHIDLFDFDYGFIGGASALIDDKVCFFGDIKSHPDFLIIKEFIEKKGKKVLSLSNKKLTDYGSLVII